jgi:hypothetical protein
MNRRITALLAALTVVATMSVATVSSAYVYSPGYAQEALAQDYAWLGYYKKHHNWPAVQAEEVKIAQEEHQLRRMNHFERNHDYSYHHDYPPGWVH